MPTKKEVLEKAFPRHMEAIKYNILNCPTHRMQIEAQVDEYLQRPTSASASTVLMQAFEFRTTPEGFKFWQDLAHSNKKDKPKTRREILQEAYPEHMEAIERNANVSLDDEPLNPKHSPGEILSSCFVWDDAPEGHEFWWKLASLHGFTPAQKELSDAN